MDLQSSIIRVKNIPSSKIYLNVTEMSEILGLSVAGVRARCRKGELRSVSMPGSKRPVYFFETRYVKKLFADFI
tara:strand:- start:173 stop:394 length:222 start_codon:yes stop_codon:yes gene_type:complete